MKLWVNGKAARYPAATSLASLMHAVGVGSRHVATVVNGTVVPRAQRAGCRLQEGDRIEIIVLAGGG